MALQKVNVNESNTNLLGKSIPGTHQNIISEGTENTFIYLKENVKNADDNLVNITSNEIDDHSNPQIMDNRIELSYQDSFKNNSDPNENTDDENDESSDLVSTDLICLPNMKHSETKDSISSIDSDLSLSFDKHYSQESQNPTCDTADNIYSDDNEKDSGCEAVNIKVNQECHLKEDVAQQIEIPDDELCEKIVEQVEFYFSNENILKDAFLLKHVRRNKEGFVSLKLVSSFKRVRQLTKDWQVVGYAIKRKSKKIEVNDLETKIRRLEALPNYDETTPSRTVVATDLPCDKITIEKVFDLFSKCGEIALVRILRVCGPIPADVRQFINKYVELQQKECALIEFVDSQSARIAQSMEGMTVLEMVAPKKKTGKKANVTKLIESCKYTETDIERTRGGDGYRPRYKRISSGNFGKSEQNNICLQRKLSYDNEDYDNFNTRRTSNCSIIYPDISRKYSSCSEGYSSCSDMSRRQSQCSDISRKLSTCSISSRKSSNCSDCCPSCVRRSSQCSDMYRRISQCSEHNRKYTSSPSYERRFSSGFDASRRPSNEFNQANKKYSSGTSPIFGTPPIYESSTRNFSNNFNPIRKLSNGDDYFINRKISSDSGCDRKFSVGSDCSTARSRSGSFMMCVGQNAPEQVVRTPIGPDGSKGFTSRTRKLGQILPPV